MSRMPVNDYKLTVAHHLADQGLQWTPFRLRNITYTEVVGHVRDSALKASVDLSILIGSSVKKAEAAISGISDDNVRKQLEGALSLRSQFRTAMAQIGIDTVRLDDHELADLDTDLRTPGVDMPGLSLSQQA